MHNLILENLKALPLREGPLIIVLDGRATAGKSTLAAALAQELAADLIHMDDFFLPAALRQESRYREIGGNVHYERFASEVLPFIRRPESFTYRRFDCHKMAYAEERLISSQKYRIVEGCYAMSSRFGRYYDFSIFCDIDKKLQRKRLLKRNGKEMARVFQEKWIPLEERYITQDKVSERADMLISL